jgi:hypothetical protein
VLGVAYGQVLAESIVAEWTISPLREGESEEIPMPTMDQREESCYVAGQVTSWEQIGA